MENLENRRRNAENTRDNIRLVAQRQFTRSGYDAIGVREIAAEAGVNVALVNRYFGSKEGLFEEAIIKEISIAGLMEGEKATFGTRIARTMASKEMTAEALDPTLVFVKSIGSRIVGPRLNAMLEEKFIPELAAWLGGEDAEIRAALILSGLLGFETMRRMAHLGPLDAANSEHVERHFAKTLQALVDST